MKGRRPILHDAPAGEGGPRFEFGFAFSILNSQFSIIPHRVEEHLAVLRGVCGVEADAQHAAIGWDGWWTDGWDIDAGLKKFAGDCDGFVGVLYVDRKSVV